MSNPIFHRRRAERFAQLLDEADRGRRHHAPLRRRRASSPSWSPSASRVRLADAGAGPRPRVPGRPAGHARGHGRARRHRRDRRPSEPTRPPSAPRWPARPGRAAACRPALAAPGARSSGRRRRRRASRSPACPRPATTRCPGDALYGVKRSTERAQLALAGSDVSRGPAVPRLRHATRPRRGGRRAGDTDASRLSAAARRHGRRTTLRRVVTAARRGRPVEHRERRPRSRPSLACRCDRQRRAT